MKRALLLLSVLLAAPAAHAGYSYPSTCASGCMIVSAYYDRGGTKDWNCGSVTYSGHRGTDFAILGGFTAMDAGRDIVSAAAGDVTYTHDGEFDRCTSGSCAGGSGFGNWVKIKHADGRETYYGHMKKGTVAVKVGDKVTCGQKLGQVGSAGYSTGPHLHFEPRMGTTAHDSFGNGACSAASTFWNDQGAYKGLPATKCDAPPPPPPPMNQAPKGSFDSADCDHIRGWAQDPDDPTKPLDVHLYWDGEAGSGAKAIIVKANLSRPDLCGPLGSCEHAFDVPVPAEYRDGKPHTINAYAIDLTGGDNPKLGGSPRTITCSNTPVEPDAAATEDTGAPLEDAAVTDSATDPEAGAPAADESTTLEGSCGCTTVGHNGDGAWIALLFVALYVQRKRVSHVA
jgi:murein DD-endopeptidase MepM/ murein hydrolase activator NlpD